MREFLEEEREERARRGRGNEFPKKGQHAADALHADDAHGDHLVLEQRLRGVTHGNVNVTATSRP